MGQRQKMHSDQRGIIQREGQEEPQSRRKSTIKKLGKKNGKEHWENHLFTAPLSERTPAHNGELGRQRERPHQGLRKAESSLANQLHTEKIRFAAISSCHQSSRGDFPGVSVRLVMRRFEARRYFLPRIELSIVRK